MGNRRPVAFLVALALTVSLAACHSSGASGGSAPNALGDNRITVGSFDFAESELLGELYSQALERGGFEVRRAFNLGPREFVGPALARGLVELIPEYAGSALLFFGVEATKPASAVQQTHEALEKTLQPLHAAALTPAPAQDANAFAVSRATAERYQLHDLSDLARVASKLVFGGPPECPSRPLCLKGLEDVYGVHFKTVVSYLDAGGPVTRQALREGEIGVGLLFTTDPSATSEGLVTLTDDRGLQPAENVTPVVRREVLDRWGAKPQTLIDAVSARLTSSELRELNAEVDRGQPIPAVASRWLDAQEHP